MGISIKCKKKKHGIRLVMSGNHTCTSSFFGIISPFFNQDLHGSVVDVVSAKVQHSLPQRVVPVVKNQESYPEKTPSKLLNSKLENHGKSPFFMGKSTISMAMKNQLFRLGHVLCRKLLT